jgi:hypothetical protein
MVRDDIARCSMVGCKLARKVFGSIFRAEKFRDSRPEHLVATVA